MAKREKLVDAIAAACENMTILSRLELAANLVCERKGEPGERGYDPVLDAVEEVIMGVIQVLETYPDSGELRQHHPNAKRDGLAWRTPEHNWPVLES